jgi:hypothetical protein
MIPTYVIGGYGRNITCLDCGLTSWHPEDVSRRYCPVCRELHDDKEKKASEPSARNPRDPFADGS